MIRVALDSNVLVYGAGIARSRDDIAKIDKIEALNRRIYAGALGFVSTQALGETFNVAVKSGLDREIASEIIKQITVPFAPVVPTLDDFDSAIELAKSHKLQIWDALILASASSARCTYLLSEDMQHGFAWRGITVLNPFAEETEARLFN